MQIYFSRIRNVAHEDQDRPELQLLPHPGAPVDWRPAPELQTALPINDLVAASASRYSSDDNGR